MLDRLRCQHLAHIRTSGRIADHAGAAAKYCDRLVACHLQTFHQAQCHEMTYMKAVCGRVKTDIENSFSFVDQFFDLFFVCNLGDQASGY